MGYATAKHIDHEAIPVLDVAGLRHGANSELRAIYDMLRVAAQGSGFFYIRNHGVPADLIERVFATSREFFAHTDEEKAQVRVNAFHRGHLRVGQARMEESRHVDLKESFIWGREPGPGEESNRLVGPNCWPSYQPAMRDILTEYLDTCNELGRLLLKAFALGLDVDPDTFICSFDRPVSRGSLIWYPPQPAKMGEEQFGVAPHTDYGCLTLLYQDGVGGLEVRDRNGDWLTAHPIEGCYVVNVGDLLQRWTNNQFSSTEHRVVNRSGRERYSVAVFVDPNFETRIEPVVAPGEASQYEPVLCGTHVLRRFDESFSYRKPENRD